MSGHRPSLSSSLASNSHVLSLSSGLQPHLTSPSNQQTVNRSPMVSHLDPSPVAYGPSPTLYDPSTAAHGPSPTLHGPSPTLYDPSPAAHGPSPTLHGPSPTLYDPSPAAHGPSPTLHGPSPTLYGPLPTAYGPSLAAHESSHSNLQETPISGSPFQGAIFTTLSSELSSPFSTNMPAHVSPVCRPSSSLIGGSALPTFPPLRFSPQNVPTPPKGLTLPPHLQSHALFGVTPPTLEQTSSETTSIVSFPASTSSMGLPEFKPLFTLSSFPVLQPAVGTTNALFKPPTTAVKFQSSLSSAPALPASSSTTVAPMFGSYFTTVSVVSSLPTVSVVQSSLQPTVSFGSQPQTKSSFNFTASPSFVFGQDNRPTLTATSESVSVPRKVLKVEEMPKSLTSGFVFQPPAVTKFCTFRSTLTTMTPAITSSRGILDAIPPFSSPSSVFNVASSPVVTVKSTDSLTLSTAQVTTTTMAFSSHTPFPFQPSQSPTFSFVSPALSKSQDVELSSHVSTQEQGVSSAFPMLSSLLSNKSVSNTQPRSSLSGSGSLPSTSAPSFVFSLQPVGTSSTTTPIPDFTFSGLSSNVNKVAERDEPDAEGQESPLDTSGGGPDFVPIVTLPELDNLLSGEENEKVLFEHRAKLYRFCSIEWKERGLGDIKILKHNTTGKVRLLMRREQILKLCCNHYLTPGMSLTYVKGSNRMLAWYTTADFAEGEARDEKLAIKFKNESIASEFKDVFEKCVSETIQTSDHSEGDYNDSEQNISATASEQFDPSCKDTHSLLAPPQSPESWTCDVCLVSNKRDSVNCIACSTLKAGSSSERLSLSTVKPGSTSLSLPPRSPGSWICNVCLVSNNKEAVQCVACTTVKSSVSTDITPLSSPFFKVSDDWTCEVCLVPNKRDSVKCIACSTLKLGTSADSLPFSAAGYSATSVSLPSLSAPTTSSGSPVPFVGFKLASGALKAAATSTFLKKSEDSSIAAISTSISGLPSGGFKLSPGTLTSAASPAITNPIPSFGISSGLSSNTPSVSSEPSGTFSLVPSSVQTSCQHLYSFTSSTSVTESKPFVFDSKLPSTFGAFPSVFPSHEEDGDEIEITEQDYEPNVYFKPIVTLPDNVDVYTGEEGSEVLFSHRAKLFRFDSRVNQWKERGIGDIKILKNDENNKVRVVMRREQVKKLCCNHFLAPKMFLSPMADSDRAWTWYTLSDFADEVSKPEKFAVKFKLVETAEHFKLVFEDCIEHLSHQCSDSTESDLSDTTNVEEDVLITHVEMPSAEKVELAEKFMLPATFFNYETKPPCPGCRGCIDLLEGQFVLDMSETTDTMTDSQNLSAGELSQDNDRKVNETETVTSVSHKDLAPKPFSGSFVSPASVSFSDLASGDSSFLFGSKSNTKSPGFARAGEVLFGSKVIDSDTDVDPESEVNIDFKPLVSLPEVELITGEESDERLFSHRAKLYRFDSTLMQWKERGVGDIKIVKNVHTNKARVLMRRDQIRKVCCNHAISPDMTLTPNQGSDKSWVWYTPCDFSDEVAKPEKLAVRFKHSDKATQFKTVFDMCKMLIPKENDQSSENCNSEDIAKDETTKNSQEISKDSTQDVGTDISQKFAPPPGSWTCDVCLVLNTQASLKCLSCGTQHASCQSPDMTKVKLVSPDSSTNRNPLLRFPLDMSPEVTRQPFVPSGSPPALYSPQVCSDLENEEVMPKLETLSEVEDVEHQSETDSTDLKSECDDLHDYQENDDVDDQDGSDRMNRDSGDIVSEGTDDSVPTLLTSSNGAETRPSLGDDSSSGDDVIFLYEELPDDSLIQKAKELMLPPSFFMYEKKLPCRGCRGCTKDSSDSFASVEVSTNEATVTQSATDPHLDDSLEDKALKQDVTPEKPFSSDPPAEESTCFFSKPGLLSFSDLAPDTASGFAQSTPGFQFHGAGKHLFSLTTAEENDDPESEADVNFKPIVSLPEVAPLKSWDDDADQLFVSRAKLYRFDTTLYQWKERGVGDMKIFRHKETGRVRMIMRRDQIFKICCNHYITAGMNLMPGSNEKSWVWLTHSDLSDDVPKSEKFAIRFKHVETAQKFKNIFEECISQEPDADNPSVSEPPKTNLLTSFKPASDSWSCSVCLVVNKAADKVCAACQTAKKRDVKIIPSDKVEDKEDRLVNVQSQPLSLPSEATGGFKLPVNLKQLTKQDISTSLNFHPINRYVMNFGTHSTSDLTGDDKKATDSIGDHKKATDNVGDDNQVVDVEHAGDGKVITEDS